LLSSPASAIRADWQYRHLEDEAWFALSGAGQNGRESWGLGPRKQILGGSNMEMASIGSDSLALDRDSTRMALDV